jgi:hypothetical protein
MTRLAAVTFGLLAAALLPPAVASAQQSNLTTTAQADAQAPAGWSLTPSLSYSAAWDDNVLIRGAGDEAPADLLNVINPRTNLDYNGRRGQLSVSYDGAFLLYRDFGTLNSYDQHAWVYARRLLTPHVALFVRNTAAVVPTTELAQLVAVPFVRTGSSLDDTHGGIEVAFTKRTSMAAGYNFEWVDFDHSQPGAESLHGGHSHGVGVNLRHVVGPRLSIVADYAFQHALMSVDNRVFDVHNGTVGVDYRVSELTRVHAAGGVSRLNETETATDRIGPAVRLGLTHHVRPADIDLSYERSFVPAYGFGGTTQNEEATAHVRLPLARRISTSSGVSWRRNDPLDESAPPLRSLWIEASIGYAMAPWAHIDVFYAGSHQTIDRPGGLTNRNRFGVQVVTVKPVRIR